MNFLNTFQERVDFLEEKGLSNIVNIQQQEKSKIVLSIKTIVQYICHRNKSLREKLLSLEKLEPKIRKLGGDVWRKLKFYPVICSIRVNSVDIRKLIEDDLSN